MCRRWEQLLYFIVQRQMIFIYLIYIWNKGKIVEVFPVGTHDFLSCNVHARRKPLLTHDEFSSLVQVDIYLPRTPARRGIFCWHGMVWYQTFVLGTTFFHREILRITEGWKKKKKKTESQGLAKPRDTLYVSCRVHIYWASETFNPSSTSCINSADRWQSR